MAEPEVPFGDKLAVRVHDTITALMVEYGGGMVTGFELCVNFMGPDGETGWATAHAANQGLSDTLGLIDFHKVIVERQIYLHMDEGVD